MQIKNFFNRVKTGLKRMCQGVKDFLYDNERCRNAKQAINNAFGLIMTVVSGIVGLKRQFV